MKAEEAIQMANKLYEARKGVKMLYGESWRKKIEPFTNTIRQKMQVDAIDELQATMRICNEVIERSPISVMLFLAAAVELIEPE